MRPLFTCLVLIAGLAAGRAAAEQGPDVVAAAHAILAARCHACHSGARQEGELRLDTAADALRGGNEGVVIRPGRSADSLLVHHVRGDGDVVMPPEGPRLTAAEVATLAAWIDAGAAWPATATAVADPRLAHWSFQPVRRVDPPAVRDAAWIRDGIDAFILARLEREGVAPAPEADRRTLARRLSFDLRGLPPSPDEVRGFVADSRPDAYERLVDRLLASPQFGERWGRHWLDRARYAETSGCVIDLPRPLAWRWRDWVVDAVNADLPFDRFTIRQIAGDLLPDATPDDRIAAGFHANALDNHEAGVDLDAERVKTTLDRTSAVGTAWLGLTVGCAQCHSHKYDPISQRDFFGLYAFFDNLDDRVIDAPLAAAAARVAAAARDLEAARDAYLSVPAPGQSAWEAEVAARPDVWRRPREFEPISSRSSRHALIRPLEDGSFQVDGRLSGRDTYVMAFRAPLTRLTAVRVEALADPERFDAGPGRGAARRALLTGVAVLTGPADKSLPTTKAEIASVEADHCGDTFRAADAIQCGESGGWLLDQPGVPHAAVFVLRQPVETGTDGRVIVRLEHQAGRGQSLARFRISVTDVEPHSLSGQCVPDEIRALVRHPAASRTADDAALLKRYHQSVASRDAADLGAWNAARSRFAAVRGPHAARTVRERGDRRDTFVHLRGDFRQPGERVVPALLPALTAAAPADRPLSRLDLATWLVDPAHPLTARVAVNDVWQHLFGAGLVATPADFGLQGDPPSHPELLDWLAGEFVRGGWSRKGLIRRIVCSSTYRQSSAARPELAERDPGNRWLARQHRHRLEAEAVRDTVLACGGLLDARLGGPGFTAAFDPDDAPEDWEPDVAPQVPADFHRRALYAVALRTEPDPLASAFDAPDGMASCAARRRTNTPIQSLALLNDPIFVAAARALAKPAAGTAAAAADEWIAGAFLRCTSREPTPRERATLGTLFRTVAAEYRAQPREAARLAEVDPGDPTAADVAARVVVARTILNLDEVVTRE